MEIITRNITIFGSSYDAELMQFDDNDKKKWWKLWDSWNKLRIGLVEYESRAPNIPEGLTETAFCMIMDSLRVIKVHNKGPSSFDTYNLATGKAEQIKATSIDNELTSFGPKSKWDDLYFLDFFRNGKMDGSFDIYLIPDKLLYKRVVNKKKNETFKKQQAQGRRPRLSLKKLAKEHHIMPIKSNVKI